MTYCSRRTGLRVHQIGLLAEAGTERLNGGLSGTGKRMQLESRVRIGRSAETVTGDVERSRLHRRTGSDREAERRAAENVTIARRESTRANRTVWLKRPVDSGVCKGRVLDAPLARSSG